MSETYGLLCFSKHWWNPLLWSHYADRHKGICLGFDVSDAYVFKINYTDLRTPFTLPLTENKMDGILSTKYSGWSYEDEWRMWVQLEEPDPEASNYYFREFDGDIELKEIIVGPLCSVSQSKLTAAMRAYSPQPKIIKARLAFKSFKVVKDQRGLDSITQE